ncbi:MAG: hypothetical protein JW762_01685, partial [Dehalococcoidales bacterium]|nr:hypothetical protein [Dehalococcoidales bacterium]
PGIAGSGLLTLTVENDTVISMDGVSYNYAAIDPIISDSWALPVELTLGTYLIEFSLPNIVTSGGTPISVRIYNNGPNGQSFSTGFTYYYIPFQISNCSVYVEEYTEDELQFLFIYYYPPSFTQPENALWMVLLPTG